MHISLDSVKPEKHDNFRGVKGAYDRAIKAIRNSVEVGFYTGISMTVTSMNEDEIEDMNKLRKQLEAHFLFLQGYIPRYPAYEDELTPKNVKKTYELVLRLQDEGEDVQYTICPDIASYMKRYGIEVYERLTPVKTCTASDFQIGILKNGDVTPCVFLHQFVLGNLLRDSLNEIIQSEITKQYRLRFRHQPCNYECEDSKICRGCRARAYAYTGDFWGVDLGCYRYSEKK